MNVRQGDKNPLAVYHLTGVRITRAGSPLRSAASTALSPSANEAMKQPFDGDKYTIALLSRGCTWGVQVDPLSKWVTVTSATKATGSSVITYSVAANSSNTTRRAFLYFSDAGPRMTVTFVC